MKADLKPFPPRTAETVERANRLLSFRDSPAYHEVLRITDQLVEEARMNQRHFIGWDAQQIVTLAIRVQVAEQFKEQLFGRISGTIAEGIEMAKAAIDQREAIDASDSLRAQVLSTASDNRIPGSF